jgi:hypothetical protein
MPRRPVRRVRVTPIAVQRERQRRVASAVVGMLLVLAVVGASLWYLAGTRREMNSDMQQRGQTAYLNVQNDLQAVWGQGRDLLTSDPKRAKGYLEDAYANLQTARQNGYTPDDLADLQTQVVDGLNRYYHVTVVSPQVVLSFGSDELSSVVLGPDGGAYVIDNTTLPTVYRIDLVTRSKIAVAVKGEPAVSGGVVGTPVLLAAGGPDILILDSANNLWRWRPAAAAAAGDGTLLQINVQDSGTWGSNVKVIGTFLTDYNLSQYSLYAVVPSAGQVLKYLESSDGSGYYASARSDYLNGQNLTVSQVDDMYIDGSVYLADNGVVRRFDSGQEIRGWTADPPGDTVMRPAPPFFTKISADADKVDQGNLYAYDGVGRRVVSFTKINGKYVQEFVLPSNSAYFSALAGMFVRTGPNGSNPTLFWIESGNLMSAPLGTPSTASPSPSVKASLSPSVKPAPSAKPSPTAKPTPSPKKT